MYCDEIELHMDFREHCQHREQEFVNLVCFDVVFSELEDFGAAQQIILCATV